MFSFVPHKILGLKHPLLDGVTQRFSRFFQEFLRFFWFFSRSANVMSAFHRAAAFVLVAGCRQELFGIGSPTLRREHFSPQHQDIG